MDDGTWWLKWCRLTQACAFLGLVDIAPYLGGQIGGQIPQNPNFWGMNRHFQAKLMKSKHILHYCVDSNQILHNEKDY